MSKPVPGRVDSVTTITNIRDVGSAINTLTHEPILHSGLLYRSARPDAASPTDRTTLTTTLNLHSIIDLRSTTEHIEQARKQSVPITKLPGVTYHEINFNGTAFSLALMKRLSWYNASKVVYLMAIGRRVDAVGIIGREVMAPRGLVGLGEDSLAYCRAEVASVFRVLCSRESYPVLVHCTQGKDRTGLVVLLVLMLCRVDRKAVEADYMASEGELESEREEKLSEIRGIGLTDEFAMCPDDWADRIMRHVDEQYGGVETYLSSCGITKGMQEDVKRVVLQT